MISSNLLRRFMIIAFALCFNHSGFSAQLFVGFHSSPSNPSDGAIGQYNSTTGSPVNAGFIPALSVPSGFVIVGDNLFVADGGGNRVGKYNANTGAVINANFITNLLAPRSIAVFGDNLYVDNGNIGKYHASTGAVINASFIHTNNGSAEAMILSLDGKFLFVANGNVVDKFDANTGATIKANFITGLTNPAGLALSANFIFVANDGNRTIGKYNASTGAAINATFITGPEFPQDVAILGNVLFVANFGAAGIGSVGKYDASTGAPIKANFLANLQEPISLGVVPEAAPQKLLNVSSRALVQPGNNVLIAGFIVSGTTAKNNIVVLRAIGPSLASAGVSNPLSDPILELHNASGAIITSNNNWQDTQKTLISATGLAPSNTRESAIYATLAAGAYTAIVRGAGSAAGVALVEVYNLQ